MTKKNGKPDWVKHAMQFKKLQAEKGMKIKEYAALHGLQENTARGAINRAIKEFAAKAADQNNDQVADQNTPPRKLRGRPRKAPETPEEPAPVKEKSKPKSRAKRAVTQAPDAPVICDQNDGEGVNEPKKRDQKSRVVSGDVVQLGRKSKKGGQPGNQNALTTGSVARVQREDVEAALKEMSQFSLAENWTDTIQSTIIQDSLAHHNLIKRARDKAMRRLLAREIDEADPAPPDPDDGPQVIYTPAEFQMVKMLNEVGYSLSDQLRTISAVMTQVSKEARDREAHQWKKEAHQLKMQQSAELHRLRMYGKLEGDVIGEAYIVLDAKDGGAIKAAQYLEMRGVKVPQTIARLVELDIKSMADEIDDTPGVSDEDLDAQVKAAEERRAGMHEWLAQRQAEVTELIDKGGYGDFDADGNRRSDEIVAILQPGEEIDLSATADLYGDNTVAPQRRNPNLLEDEYDEEQQTAEEEDASLWKGEDAFHEDDDEDEPDESINSWNNPEDNA